MAVIALAVVVFAIRILIDIVYSSHPFSWAVVTQAVSGQTHQCRLTWIIVAFVRQVFLQFFLGVWSDFHHYFLAFLLLPYPLFSFH